MWAVTHDIVPNIVHVRLGVSSASIDFHEKVKPASVPSFLISRSSPLECSYTQKDINYVFISNIHRRWVNTCGWCRRAA